MKTPSKSAPTQTLHNQVATLEQRLGPIGHRPPAFLRTYARNPRQHPDSQIVKLTARARARSSAEMTRKPIARGF